MQAILKCPVEAMLLLKTSDLNTQSDLRNFFFFLIISLKLLFSQEVLQELDG